MSGGPECVYRREDRRDDSLVGRLNDMARSVEGGGVDTAELAALLRGTADAIEALCASLARFTEADSRWSGERIPRSESEVEQTREGLCMICGVEYPGWHAPSDLWNRVMRGGNRANADDYPFACPTCFTRLAVERGVDAHFVVSTEAADPQCPHGERMFAPTCPACSVERVFAP